MRSTPLAAAAVIALATVPFTAVAASADPQGDSFDVVCDNGHTYPVTTNGNGEFTPAHDTSSTSVLVPTSFHGFSFTITDADGHVVDSFTDDSVESKGRSEKPRRTMTTCTYSATETFEDPEHPELGLLTATFSGGVTGFVTPVR